MQSDQHTAGSPVELQPGFDMDHYLSLAPAELGIHREERYGGGDFSVSIEAFSPEDRDLLTKIYARVKSVYDIWLYMREKPNYRLYAKDVEFFSSDEFFRMGREFGNASYSRGEAPESLRKVIHDIRGGAIQCLISYASYLKMTGQTDSDEKMHSLVFLCRDHAKMMRNTVHDLDIPTLQADEFFRLHPVGDFLKKWREMSYTSEGRSISVKVRSDFSGNISTRCLEASSIDRVLYNYMNNAIRFTSDGTVGLTLVQTGSLVRWVVENRISEENRQWLADNVGSDLRRLYRGGLTNGGNGIGLGNCADIVAASIGVPVARALDEGYIGAALADDTYYAWFHWPKA